MKGKSPVLNIILLTLSITGLIIISICGDSLERNDYNNVFDTLVLFKCFLLLAAIRCYLGVFSFPKTVVSFSLNLIRFSALLISAILPYTWFSFISLTPTLNAIVLSFIFDVLVSKGNDLYLSRDFA